MLTTLLLAVCLAAPGQAAEGGENDPLAPIAADEGALIPGIPPGPQPPPDQVQPLAYEIGLKLRCPVCQGLSVADSSAETAVGMQRRIRELVGLGYSEDQIRDYFVDRYGEWILLDPEPEGLNLLIWVGPGIMVGLGLAWAVTTVVTWRKEPDDVPLPSDEGLVAKDKYEQRLLAELED